MAHGDGLDLFSCFEDFYLFLAEIGYFVFEVDVEDDALLVNLLRFEAPLNDKEAVFADAKEIAMLLIVMSVQKRHLRQESHQTFILLVIFL